MDKQQFVETYCTNCGTQRCEGIDSEWFDGCQYKWNLDGLDPATKIMELEKQVLDLASKLASANKTHSFWEVQRTSQIIHIKCKCCNYTKRFDRLDSITEENVAIVDPFLQEYMHCPNCGSVMDL